MKQIQDPATFIQTAGERAQAYGIRYHGCAQATMAALQELLEIKSDTLLAASSCFVGGVTAVPVLRPALSAGFMIFGVLYGRYRLEDGPESLDRALEPAGKLVDRFLEAYHTTNCCELTGFDMRDPKQRDLFAQTKEVTAKCEERIKRTTEWIAEWIVENQ